MFTVQEIKDRIAEIRASGANLPAGYNLACFIADAALILQTDKANADYAHHTTEVSRHNTDSVTKMIIGKLHDVVEDSDWTLDDLREVGFPERVVRAVGALTHRDGEPYFDSIERASLNPYALDVKIKDLRHNLSGFRNNWVPTEKDLKRIQKYTIAYNYLVAIKKQEIVPGTQIPFYMAKHPNFKDYVRSDFIGEWTSLPAHLWLPSTPKGPAPK